MTPPGEEFDVDGRKVTKDALFQTYRQFSHLQQRHQEAKPYLDLMQELNLTPDQVPQFRAWIAGQLQPAAPAAPPTQMETLESQPWYQEIAETFPQFASTLKAEIMARQAAESRFAKIEESLTGFTSAIENRQRQEQAVNILSTAADNVNSMMTDFPRLQNPEVRGAFLRWVWDEQKPGAKIADPKYLRGMYLVFDEAALAEQWAAKASASQTAHAATVARGFAETGAPRTATAPNDKLTKELQEMMTYT
ncbi:MAG: hypothetical protein EPN22_17250 [Nitrospirae bacterium]|nr:MAG: hypothetical protein EPN22_17250 [Nitrospirota bacterium]